MGRPGRGRGGSFDEGLTPAMLEVYGADCPVPLAVWRRFTDDDDPVDLILELQTGASAPLVAISLLGLLRRDGGTPNVVTVSSFVVVSVTVEELVTGVLALTSWRPLLVKAGALTEAAIRRELADLEASARLRSRRGWEIQDLGRFRWLIARIVEVLGDDVTPEELGGLFRRAAEGVEDSDASPVRTVGTNRPVIPAVLESRVTVKADAAERVFEIDASTITWAVVDSGIDPTNRAFWTPGGAARGRRQEPGRSRILRSYDVPRAVTELRAVRPGQFIGMVDDAAWERFEGLANRTGTGHAQIVDPVVRHHGTHVAGVLAADERGHRLRRPPLVGVCPTVELVDINVFDEDGWCEELWVLVALRFIRWINETGQLGDRRIDGVNLSISTRYDVDAQACGWTPVCEEAERLVASGVVVVVAAGNQAYDSATGPASVGTGFRFLSITDPGNAESVITVGATDKRSPHRFGPIAGSGRGPTADGRHKPDLLAPGLQVLGPAFEAEPQEMTGTSQAAPHVSGVAAMLLARFPELRGQPQRVKEILCESATDLGRLRDFQGAGLLDALRALQRP